MTSTTLSPSGSARKMKPNAIRWWNRMSTYFVKARSSLGGYSDDSKRWLISSYALATVEAVVGFSLGAPPREHMRQASRLRVGQVGESLAWTQGGGEGTDG